MSPSIRWTTRTWPRTLRQPRRDRPQRALWCAPACRCRTLGARDHRRRAGTLGSIRQLAAEYETIADTAQHDRWASLLTASGLTDDQVDAALGSPAFGALITEMRRAEANRHDLDQLMPRLVHVRGFEDAEDIASVLHWRVARAASRPAGSGRTRKPRA